LLFVHIFLYLCISNIGKYEKITPFHLTYSPPTSRFALQVIPPFIFKTLLNFVLGGDNHIIDTNYLDFWRFNPSTDSWERMADFPDSETFLPAFFVIGNYGYVVTGQGNHVTGWTNRCWQYNAITNKWTEKARFPGAPRDGAIGFSIGAKGYVGMGSSDYGLENYKDIWSYDTASDIWSQIENFAAGLYYYRVVDNKQNLIKSDKLLIIR
jgi:hypothetical protein